MRRNCRTIAALTLLLTLAVSVLVPRANAEQPDELIHNWSQAEDYVNSLIEVEYPFAKDEVVLDVHQEFVMRDMDYYSFYFKRMIDGIPYPGNYIFFTFDQTGTKIAQTIFWDKQLRISEQGPLMETENAKAKFVEHMDALIFNQPSGSSIQTGAAATYYKYDLRPDTLIDASTGELFETNSNHIWAADDKLPAGKPEERSVQPIATEKEALERASLLVAAWSDLGNPTIRTEPSSSFNNRLEGPFWNVSWKKSNSCYLTIQFQQSTGQLVSFTNQCAPEDNHSINEEEARQQALQMIRQYTPPRIHQQLAVEDVYPVTVTQGERAGTQSYEVKVVRRIPGVWSTGNILVGIDRQTGSISYFYNNLDDPKDEPLPKVDKSKLNGMLIDKYDLQLRYEAVTDYKRDARRERPSTGIINEELNEVKLVYLLSPRKEYANYAVDAEKAVWRNVITGKETTKASIESDLQQ